MHLIDGLAHPGFRSARTALRTLWSNTITSSVSLLAKYHEHTLRVVKTLVLAAKWLADQDAHPESAFQLWTRSGVTFANYEEDWQKASLKVMSSPLVDEYIISQYNWNIQEAKRFGLIRNTFGFEDWYEVVRG